VRECSLGFSSDPDSCNMVISSRLRGFSSPSGGSIATAFGQFMGSDNNAPDKAWAGLMSYNAIDGITRIIGMGCLLFPEWDHPCELLKSHDKSSA